MLKHVIIAALMQTLTGLVVLIPGACITNLTFFTGPLRVAIPCTGIMKQDTDSVMYGLLN